ncbi:MAG: DciA family protein, partial [Phenylobacterium sp.]|nr:DciA family protein [Phenylobacterium sp.]
MRRRSLPSLEEARAILSAKRTRPVHRPPPPAGRALRAYVKGLDDRFGQGADGLSARWREVVGPEVARRTEPVKLTRGRAGGPSTLEIRVAGPAAAIIQHQAHEILSRVNLFLGPNAVQKLRIVQGPLRRA